MLFQLLRFLLVITGTIAGVALGFGVSYQYENVLDTENPELKLAALLGCIGYLFCSMSGREFQHWIEDKLEKTNSYDLAWGGAGLVIGLVSANLLLIPVYFLMNKGLGDLNIENKYFRSLIPLFNVVIPLLFNLLFAYVGACVLLRYRNIHTRVGSFDVGVMPKILDSSAVIDGRVAELFRLGFLEGRFMAPRFVVSELQFLADSSDDLQRSKGRQGLDNLNRLRREYPDDVLIIDHDFPAISEVDSKLVALAKQDKGILITQDFNLKKIAELDGIKVLNLNDLMNALKPIFVSGEEIDIQLIRPGKEPGQGVGFLSDGTMIVVEDGGAAVGQRVTTTVTNILQTSAGRMIFARINPKQTPDKK